MKTVNRREPWILFVGDVLVWLFALWLTLLIRFGEAPIWSTYHEHLVPFSILSIFWIITYFISGLYDKQTRLFRRSLPSLLFNTQLFNSALAVVFFYFVPFFGITPKTILFVYLIISSLLIFFWRTFGQGTFGVRKSEKTIIVGQGQELIDLAEEIKSNSRYGLDLVGTVNLSADFNLAALIDLIKKTEAVVLVIDFKNKYFSKELSSLYNLLFSDVRFLDFTNLYEQVFDCLPVLSLNYDWFLQNVSHQSDGVYDLIKRLMDFIFALVFGLISLIFYPLVILAIKLDDRGPIFIQQERVGQNNSLIRIYKFRSMSFNDDENPVMALNNKITKVGKFLRNSRLDELPQLWNVLTGDLSLVGPRPELPNLVKKYEQQIPYYQVRHLLKPGLSGWAQIYHDNHPHRGLNIEETKNKLSYDLFYLKNRSLWLDLQVVLKTIKTLLSRVGR